ncbi:MAG: SHOCT domain-containing protein [Leptospiraceae bacterium]|nr:SHOCT domain-containing protein [Leptospiraceae bacterium]
MTAKYCSKKCISEGERSGKEIKAEKAAKGSFVENLTKNIEDTKKGINMVKSFFGKGKQEEPTPNIQQVQAQLNSNLSVADELKKFKELLDAGVLTQEEFDKKKKELIG